MSYVLDQVRRIDAQLDRLQLSSLPAAIPATSAEVNTSSSSSSSSNTHGSAGLPSKRILVLQAAIRGLSPSESDSHALLHPKQIQTLLSSLSERSDISTATEGHDGRESDPYETELEWLLASKATTQVYGLAIDSLLGSAEKTADDLWYWDEVLSSRRYTALYSVQTSPLRLYDWGSKVWEDVKARGGRFNIRDASQDAQETVQQSWREFYGLVKQVVRQRSVEEVHKQMLSPITRLRGEVRQKQKALRNIRLRNANAIGVLLGEGLANESVHGDGLATPSAQDVQHKWKGSVARNVALMEAVLAKVNDLETSVDKFDAAVGELTEEDPLYTCEVYDTAAEDGSVVSVSPRAVAERLSRVLTLALPQYTDSTRLLLSEHGRPSTLTRYWLPVSIAVLSSSTILRILVNRQAEILQWVQEFGATVLDFWQNWVVEPVRKVIGTIRHDEGSEVSIMSKRSLEGDRESLERMVVDFAVENPANATGSGAKLTETQIADIRAKVREGDLTPVLKAYEKDLASPLMGTVRGNLIRALLIQIQKTKVDVEVAIGGIDSLLKSQELVFGFVGLTPGILVTYFAASYLRSSLSQKRGSEAATKQGKMLRQLRNVDRVLTDATATEFGELHYKDQGLLLCEVHVLRRQAKRVMPMEIYREFCEEADELCDVRAGVQKQRLVAERVRWAYGRWLA